MIVSFKDALKLIGIVIVAFCAVFVCTFMLNYYLDVQSIRPLLSTPYEISLYTAQISMLKVTSAVSGGCLTVISLIMLVFYVGMHVEGRSKQLGLLKAIGWSEGKIALKFWVYGLSVFIGTGLGFGVAFAAMPSIYVSLCGKELPAVAISFHPVLLCVLVILPTVIFSALASIFAYIKLRRPAYELLKGVKEIKIKKSKPSKVTRHSFMREMARSSLSSKKMLAFFVAFACFCFSAMVQMGISMFELSSVTMGVVILIIGLVLAVSTILMAITTLVRYNLKNISMMKAFGYTTFDCALTVFGLYHIFALLGFAVGTVYQYGLLSLMVDLVFRDVGYGIEYCFDFKALLIAFAAFIVFFEAVAGGYTYKLNKISVKEIMTVN